MKYQIEKENYYEFMNSLEELEELLTQRISDLYEVKGMMQARHAYLYYRNILTDSRSRFSQQIKTTKE